MYLSNIKAGDRVRWIPSDGCRKAGSVDTDGVAAKVFATTVHIRTEGDEPHVFVAARSRVHIVNAKGQEVIRFRGAGENINTTMATLPKVRFGQGGSLQNRLAECGVKGQPIPASGMGATQLCYTDRHACTIFVVEMNASRQVKRIGVKRDRAIRTDTNQMSECQSYRYEQQPDAGTFWYTLRKTGQWIMEGDPLRNGQVLAIGYRDEYHDYSF